MDIPAAGAGAQGSVEVDILAADGTVYDAARLMHGGVAVPVPLNKPQLSTPVRVRLTLRGGSAPDRVPRFFAMEY